MKQTSLNAISRYIRASPGELGAIALGAALILGGSAFVWARTSGPPPAEIKHVASVARSSAAVTVVKKVTVHVAGMVVTPGVYELNEGARVKDAIAAAGGPAAGADVNALNLAALLQDGQKIFVPKPGEASGGQNEGAQGGMAAGKVNLNTASESELESLPSVGPVMAGRIIQYRQTKGGFRSVRDLLKVDGFGPRKFESLKDLVTV
ncbi:MAG: ComEA family DNA-binding protein [Actinomycetota bacterium]|nr:helix-hairpin-helix domain-containing protein [Actinomycetota bacterium]